MNSLSDNPTEIKHDHHRAFLGLDGNLRIAVPGQGWRTASALEAALLSPCVRHRVTGFRDEG